MENIEEVIEVELEETNDVEAEEEEVVAEELEEETDDDEEFDPEQDLFDEEDIYNIEGYDLSAFKEQLNLEDSENLEIITNYAKELKDKGFTQEQVEYLLAKEFEDEVEEKPKKNKTAREIKEQLSQSLTSEEKRNYKAVGAFVTDILEGTELEEFRNEIMSNPNLVKLFNIAYTKSLGKTGKLQPAVSKRAEKTIRSVGFDDARAELMKAVTTRGDKDKVAKELYAKVSDRESFKAFAKAVGVTL